MAKLMKSARDWFKAHPRCKVIFHRRWKELSCASRERLEMPRDVSISGYGANFSDGSYLGLMSDGTSLVSEGGLLDVYDPNGQIIVTYADAD